MRCGKIVMTSDQISIGRGQQEPSDAVLSLRVAPNASLGVIIDGLSEMIDWARHGRNQIASETVETSDRCKRYVKSDAQVLLEVQQSAHRAAADPCCAGKQGKQYDSFESFVFHLRLHTQPQPGGYYRCPWTGRTDSSPAWFRWESTCRQQLIELAKQVGVTFVEQVEEVAA